MDVHSDSHGDSSEAKRPCSDAASSCSEEGSIRSSSPRSPPLPESPTPNHSRNDVTPPPQHPVYPAELPYPFGHFPMHIPLGLWPSPQTLSSQYQWSLPPPPPPRVPLSSPTIPSAPQPPCRRLKSFTISALLGEG